MNFPIGIIDYGIGGMGLAKMIKTNHPNLPILYFSDSGHIPYGKLSHNALRARIEKILTYLFSQGVEHIVVACHSASSVITPCDLHVTGITDITITSVINSGVRNVGIIGGGRTVRSGVYRKGLANSGIDIKQRIAQELSILVERGEINGTYVEKTIMNILHPIKNQEALLLACTHYPVLIPIIKKCLPSDTLIIDPIQQVYNSIEVHLKNDNYTNQDRFITTGDTHLMKKASLLSFGMEIPEALFLEFD